MAFPQGIYFRGTDNQVDPTDYDCDNGSNNYPRTSAQGNTVGWEGSTATYVDRTWADKRFSGGMYFNYTLTKDYRIDLPSSGLYLLGCALGDANFAACARVRALDTSTVLHDFDAPDNTTASTYYDIVGNSHSSQTAWANNSVGLSLTFATTICRFRFGGATKGTSGNVVVPNLMVSQLSAGGGGGATLIYCRSLLGVGY